MKILSEQLFVCPSTGFKRQDLKWKIFLMLKLQLLSVKDFHLLNFLAPELFFF